jgi:AraC-like DNA-binding protein
MTVDRLEVLLQRFSVSARMFHSGPLCGINDFAPQPDLGQLHLIRRGRVDITHAGADLCVEQPSLLFYPRPMAHRFHTDAQTGADMACAHVRFDAGQSSPLAAALPAFVCLPLIALDDTTHLLEALFDEAFGSRCGRQAVVDRLFEVVLIRILRQLIASMQVDGGLLAGLAHPQLARALVALHEQPAQAWTLNAMARCAGLSRSTFAAQFHRTLGVTPAHYLARWRIGLAQQSLRAGRPLKVIADEVGYGSAAALSRAFTEHCGHAPRDWLRRQ